MTRQPQRQDPDEEKIGIAGISTWILRLSLLFITITAILTAGFVCYNWWLNASPDRSTTITGGDPSLNPAERIYLQTYLTSNAQALNAPVGASEEAILFVVSPGENANIIAGNLATAKLITNETLFTNYLRFYGLDDELEAGTFQLSPTLSTAEIAIALTRATRVDETITFIEGWRVEQMVDHLRQNPTAQIDATQFLEIATRTTPFDLTAYNFLAAHPPNKTLEGYLFPDTYRLDPNATASDLIHKMLDNFNTRITPDMRQEMGAQGLTLAEAVNLAGIVEREAVVTSERPLIARVFLNRLNQGIKLDADPTIQYVLGQQEDGNWWKSPLWVDDLVLDSPFNTYLYIGLPPNPIANPGLSSLQAVTHPASVEYIFFVADCNPQAPGTHIFSLTYEEHVTNVEKCR
ncbi:MAG: endolytic transglycosylase MltG [Methylococcales bacterium]|nr:endolytic transglycosylase MltG [Methylococcales bacterium]